MLSTQTTSLATTYVVVQRKVDSKESLKLNFSLNNEGPVAGKNLYV